MAKAVSPGSAAHFWDLLAKSGLYDDDSLGALRQQLDGLESPAEIAGRLLEMEKLSAWQAQQLLSGQFVLRLADYRLLDELAEWEFGRALLAEPAATGEKHVHLKLLSSKFLKDEVLWKEVLGDLRKAARIKDPVLFPFREVGRAGSRYFLIGEASGARSLGHYVNTHGAAGSRSVARWLRQLAEALRGLQQFELTHDCLRPACILIDAGGAARVSDIGLGRLVLSSSDVPPALLAYRPPADFSASSSAADWYALGKIGRTLLDAPKKDAAAAPAWWTDEAADAAARQQLQALCDRLMQSDPAIALHSAAAVLDELDSWSDRHGGVPACETAVAAVAVEKPEPLQVAPVGAADKVDRGSVGPVVIETRRRKKTPAKSTAAAADSPAKRRSQSRLLIISSAALVLAAVSLAGAMWLRNYWNTSHAREVAQQTAATPAATTRPTGTADAQPASDPLLNLESDPVIPAPAADAPSAAPQPANTAQSGPPAGIAELGAAPSGAVASRETVAATEAGLPSATSPPPVNPAAGSQVPQPAAEQPSAEPSPDAPPPSANTPANTPPANTPPANTPPASPAPYRDLPGSVDLPPLDSGAGEAAVLGTVHVADEIPCFLELLGGDRLPRGIPTLKLENAEGGTAARKWDVYAVPSPGMRTAVGQFSLLEGNLAFQWLPTATAASGAGMLQNCFLQFNIANDIRALGLRKTILVKPLVLDLNKGVMTEKYDISNPPDPASCRFEIVSLDGAFPPHELKPAGNISAADGTQWILLGENRADQIMALHIECSLKKQFQWTTTAVLQLGEEPHERWAKDRDRRITKAGRTQFQQQWQLLHAQLAQQLAQANAIDLSKVTDRGQKQELERRKNLLNVDHDKAAAQHKMADRLVELCDGLNDRGVIHFRVVFEIDGKSVELLRSQGAP